MTNFEEFVNTLSPYDFNQIKNEIGSMLNRNDNFAENYENSVLEQIYEKYNSRLNSLSERLANSNKQYTKLHNLLNKNSNFNKILNPNSDIKTAAEVLKNYKSTNDNFYDLENMLVSELGEQPFLSNIDDVNAAIDLLKSPKTGFYPLGLNNFVKRSTGYLLKGLRGLNRSQILKGLNNGERSLLQRTLTPITVEEIPLLLQGGVEMNVPYSLNSDY